MSGFELPLPGLPVLDDGRGARLLLPSELLVFDLPAIGEGTVGTGGGVKVAMGLVDREGQGLLSVDA